MKVVVGLGVLAVLIFGLVVMQKPAQAKGGDIKLKTFVHYPKEPGRPAPTPVSNCTATTNDGVNDFGLTGWQMPTSGMTYKINYSSKPNNLSESEVSNSITSSFNTWHAADSNQIFSDGGATTIRAAKFDGTNAILWKSISNGALAITYAWYYPSTGLLAESDTVFNRNYKWTTSNPASGDCGGVAGAYDLQNIGTHEFGHWVGLEDLYADVDKDLTMYGYGETTELKKDSLGTGDKSGVIAVSP